MDLEEVIKDQQRLLNEKESAYNEMISKINGQIETMKGQIEIHQRLQDEVTNRSESLEAEIISLKEDLEKSNKKNK